MPWVCPFFVRSPAGTAPAPARIFQADVVSSFATVGMMEMHRQHAAPAAECPFAKPAPNGGGGGMDMMSMMHNSERPPSH
jgi:hypothetical protein